MQQPHFQQSLMSWKGVTVATIWPTAFETAAWVAAASCHRRLQQQQQHHQRARARARARVHQRSEYKETSTVRQIVQQRVQAGQQSTMVIVRYSLRLLFPHTSSCYVNHVVVKLQPNLSQKPRDRSDNQAYFQTVSRVQAALPPQMPLESEVASPTLSTC